MADNIIPVGDTAVVAQGAQPATQPAVPQAPAPVISAPVAPELPQGASERTADQFNKLLESNKILTDLLRTQTAAVPQPIPTPTPAEPNIADFTKVNPITGEEYIDKEKLTRALTSATEEARSSRALAEQAMNDSRRRAEDANRREIERQEIETFAVYPELNRKTQSFDDRFEKQVRGVLLDSYVNVNAYGGRPLSFLEAAKFVKQNPNTPVVPEAPTAVVQVQPTTTTVTPTAQELKQQATVSVPSQPQQALPASNAEEAQRLSLKTRLGDDNALAERLKYTEHIATPESTIEGGA